MAVERANKRQQSYRRFWTASSTRAIVIDAWVRVSLVGNRPDYG